MIDVMTNDKISETTIDSTDIQMTDPSSETTKKTNHKIKESDLADFFLAEDPQVSSNLIKILELYHFFYLNY